MSIETSFAALSPLTVKLCAHMASYAFLSKSEAGAGAIHKSQRHFDGNAFSDELRSYPLLGVVPD